MLARKMIVGMVLVALVLMSGAARCETGHYLNFYEIRYSGHEGIPRPDGLVNFTIGQWDYDDLEQYNYVSFKTIHGHWTVHDDDDGSWNSAYYNAVELSDADIIDLFTMYGATIISKHKLQKADIEALHQRMNDPYDSIYDANLFDYNDLTYGVLLDANDDPRLDEGGNVIADSPDSNYHDGKTIVIPVSYNTENPARLMFNMNNLCVRKYAALYGLKMLSNSKDNSLFVDNITVDTSQREYICDCDSSEWKKAVNIYSNQIIEILKEIKDEGEDPNIIVNGLRANHSYRDRMYKNLSDSNGPDPNFGCVDGIMMENRFWFDDGYGSPSYVWCTDIDFYRWWLERASDNDKKILFCASSWPGYEDDFQTDSQLVANIWLWLHLVADANTHSVMSYNYSSPMIDYGIYDYPLGDPCEDPWQDGEVWSREYERGTIIFDTSSGKLDDIKIVSDFTFGPVHNITQSTWYWEIAPAIEHANDGDVIEVNQGTYVTGPIIIDNNYIRISFQEDVTVLAESGAFKVDPANPDSRGDCLFEATNKRGIIFDGNDTIFKMRKDEYPKAWEFDASSDVDLDSNTITINGHGYETADIVKYKHGDSHTTIGGLEEDESYYVIWNDENTIQLALDADKANNDDEINLTSKPSSSEMHQLDGGSSLHVIRLNKCSDIEIKNLTLKDGGGDGILIGGDIDAPLHGHSNNILIENVTCDNNYRTGIAVISANDVNITECVLQGTGGYLNGPCAGIDFEPYKSEHRLTNISIRKSEIKDNEQSGLIISMYGLTEDSCDVSISVHDCNISGGLKYGMYVAYAYEDGGVEGEIEFRNVEVNDVTRGIGVLDKSVEKVFVSFDKCDVKNTVSYPIWLVTWNYANRVINKPGGIDFYDCKVIDDVNRCAIRHYRNEGEGENLYEIHGDIYVENPNCADRNLWDWNEAELHRVDLIVHANDLNVGECRAHNATTHHCYTSIQSAIDNSSSGDVIKVSPENHYETIDFDGNTLTLQSRDPNYWDMTEATVIDANGRDWAIYVDTASTISGLTITGGTDGVYCDSASPVIEKCIIEDNTTTGVYCSGGGPEIINNLIFDNGSYGIYSDGSSAEIKNNWIYRNDSEGLKFEGEVGLAPLVRNNTIAYNSSKGVCIGKGKVTKPEVSNCILWGNTDELDGAGATYSCIEDEDDKGKGNIYDDPLFVDADGNDFHLEADSPCIEAGDDSESYTGEVDIDFEERLFDADNDGSAVVDMGADETYWPVSWWKFDEGADSTAYDSAVGGNDGTVYNATWTTGQIDGALDFDGSGDYVGLGSPASLDDLPTGDMSVCAWIYDEHSAGTTWGTIFGAYDSDGWCLRTFSNASGDRSLYFQAEHAITWADYWSSDGTISTDTWHHVAAVWDADTKTAKLYIDGSEPSYQTSTGAVGTYDTDAAKDKEIGRLPHVEGCQEFNGKIDDVRIYNRALSDEEVEELYEEGSGT